MSINLCFVVDLTLFGCVLFGMFVMKVNAKASLLDCGWRREWTLMNQKFAMQWHPLIRHHVLSCRMFALSRHHVSSLFHADSLFLACLIDFALRFAFSRSSLTRTVCGEAHTLSFSKYFEDSLNTYWDGWPVGCSLSLFGVCSMVPNDGNNEEKSTRMINVDTACVGVVPKEHSMQFRNAHSSWPNQPMKLLAVCIFGLTNGDDTREEVGVAMPSLATSSFQDAAGSLILSNMNG